MPDSLYVFTDGSIDLEDNGITVCFWRGSGDKRHLHCEELSARAAFEILSASLDACLPNPVADGARSAPVQRVVGRISESGDRP